MTLWDYYASRAPISDDMLEEACSNARQTGIRCEEALLKGCDIIANVAAEYADAMLRERARRNLTGPSNPANGR